jgi:hypothetical protein
MKMKNFKKMVAAITLTVMLSMSTVMADPGIIISDLTGNTTPAGCKAQADDTANGGIIVFGVTGGIIVFGLTGGIIVFGKTAPTTNTVDTTCK